MPQSTESSESSAPAARPGPIVRVRGEARRSVDPEIARFTVLASAQDKDRRRTLELLTKRNDVLRKRIDDCGDAIEEVGTSGMRVQPMLRDRRGERVRNYHGQLRLQAVINDFDALASLLTELADQEMTEVVGPWWQLRPDSEVYVQARSSAVREAVERARVYAAALGSRLTGLVELADVGLSSQLDYSTEADMPGAAFGVTRAAGAADAALPRLELDPQPIEVVAELEATFTISPPTDL